MLGLLQKCPKKTVTLEWCGTAPKQWFLESNNLRVIFRQMYCIYSVQHTGTYFTMDLVSRHSKICGCIGMKDFSDFSIDGSGRLDLDNVLPLSEIIQRKDLDVTGIPVLHAHIDAINSYNFAQKFMSSMNLQGTIQKTIVPVRDPMKSLVSRQNRYPFLNHEYIVDGFVSLSKMKDVFFLPIDLYEKFEERKSLLRNMFSYLGLNYEEQFDDVAHLWKPKGTIRGSLKERYLTGRIMEVAHHFSDEYNYLKENESIIKPFLERLGYRNLPWWNCSKYPAIL